MVDTNAQPQALDPTAAYIGSRFEGCLSAPALAAGVCDKYISLFQLFFPYV